MSLHDFKIIGYAKNIKDLPDRPNFSGTVMKEWFDARTDKEVPESINGIIDTLEAVIPGASGAGSIGLSPITGIISSDVQGAIEETYTSVDTKIEQKIHDIGAGDMTKAEFAGATPGTVKNSDKLEGNTLAQVVDASGDMFKTTYDPDNIEAPYQPASDDELHTNDKTVVGAINELLANRVVRAEEEKRVGYDFISGKPIYQKVLVIPSLPNATTGSYPHGIANAEKIWLVNAFAGTTAGSYVPMPHVSSGSIQVGWNLTTFNIITVANASTYRGEVTLQYTKTTD